jgi:hypothetical protein
MNTTTVELPFGLEEEHLIPEGNLSTSAWETELFWIANNCDAEEAAMILLAASALKARNPEVRLADALKTATIWSRG